MLGENLTRRQVKTNINNKESGPGNDLLSINAVYIFQRDANLNSRFHNTSIKVKAQT